MSKKILFMSSAKLTAFSIGLLLAVFCTVGMSFTPGEEGENLSNPNDTTYVPGPRRGHWDNSSTSCGTTTHKYNSRVDYAKTIVQTTGNGSVTISTTETNNVTNPNSGSPRTATSGTTSGDKAFIEWNSGLTETDQSSAKYTAAQITAAHKKAFKLTATPINDDYYCVGWGTTASESSIFAEGNSCDVTSDMEITGYASKSSDPSSYTNSSSPYTETYYAFFKKRTAGSVTLKPGVNGTVKYAYSGVSTTTVSSDVTFSTQADVTLTAEPAANYEFYGWYTLDGTTENYIYKSTPFTRAYTSDITIYAKFIPKGSAYFTLKGTSLEFYDFGAALTAAKNSSSNKVVVPTKDGIVPVGNYEIYSGVTLLVPKDGDFTLKTTNPGYDQTTRQTVALYRKLTLVDGVNITVNGSISVGGKVCAGNGGTVVGGMSGPFGQIHMNSGSSIVLNNGANLYCWGYITGAGTIDAKSGSNVYEPFQFDFRGGSHLEKVYTKCFPVNQYFVHNVEVPITFRNGSSETLYSAFTYSVFGSTTSSEVSPVFIGSAGLFRLGSDAYITRRYDGATDRQLYDLYGDASINSISMSVAGYSLNTTSYILPITNNMNLCIHSGTTTIEYDVSVLADCNVTIDNGATINVKKNLYVYDRAEWVGENLAMSGDLNIPYYAAGRTYTSTTATGRTAAKMNSAKLKVNGTISMASSAGMLYTTATGGDICSETNGAKVVLTNGTGSKESIVESVGTSKKTTNVSITPAKLHNASQWYSAPYTGTGKACEYLATAGAAANTTITYADGHWGWMEIWTDENNNVLYASNTPAKVNKESAKTCPAKTGYNGSWTTTSNATTDGLQKVLHKASYVPQVYSITYKDQGDAAFSGTHATGYPTSHTYANATTLKTATKTGYDFGGWFTNKECTGSAVTSLGATAYTADITLYAKWTANNYSITYKDQGNADFSGTHADGYPTSHTYGTATTLKTATKTGYDFGGWFANKECTGEAVTSLGATAYTAGITLYAKWTEKTYVVTFNNGGHGTVQVAGVTVANGATASVNHFTTKSLAVTSSTGYTFAGWSTTGSVTLGSTSDASTNITATAAGGSVTATWTANNYSITYRDQGNADFSGTHADGYPTSHTYGTATTLKTATKTGYDFGGWFANEGCTGEALTSLGATAYTAGITLYAKWTEKTYVVTFNNGGHGTVQVAGVTVANGATASVNHFTTKSLAVTSSTGYTFAGWSTTGSVTLGSTSDASTNITATAAGGTVTATWTANNYSITYRDQGNADFSGTHADGYPTSHTYGTATTLKTATKTGYDFGGWFANEGCTGEALTSLGATAYTADITLYAKWTLKKFSFTIGATPAGYGSVSASSIHDIAYGSSVTTEGNNLKVNGTVVCTAIPTASDAQYTYTCDHWNNVPATVTCDVTNIEAVFTRTVQTYTITWKNQNGDVLRTDVNVEYGQTPSYGSTPTLGPTESTVYTFVQWIPEVVSVTKDTTITANYTAAPRPYPVVWKNYNGDVLKESTRLWGWDAPAASTYDGVTPTKPGDVNRTCAFSGWSDPVSVVEGGDVTYTAQFNVSMLVTETTPLTITSEETATTTTVKVSGKLDVTAGTLTTNELILEASENASGEIITGANNIVVPQSGNAYFDLTHEGNEDVGPGFKANTWYAIAVPWMVNVPVEGQGGVFLKNGGALTPQRLGIDFDLIYYDGARRADGDVKAWNFLQDDPVSPAVGQHVMTPGVAYMIYLTEDAETIRFQKRTSAPFHTDGVEVSAHESTNPTYKNWNGIANPATYHAYMNAHTTDSVGQVYVAETRQYKKFHMGKNKLLVGQPIFIQPDKSRLVFAKDTYNDNSSTSVRRRAKRQFSLTRYELYLAPSQDIATDEIIVRMSEEKQENDYVVGQDLVKMGVSGIVPQMWIDRYESKMFINTVAPDEDNTADYPLGIFVPQNGEYDLFLDDELDSESNLYLTYDGEAIWNLTYGPYVASLEKGTNTHYGLRIVKKAPQATTGIEETTIQNGEAVRKVLVNDKVYIIRNGVRYSVTGQKAK